MATDRPVGVAEVLALHDAMSGCQSCAQLRSRLTAARNAWVAFNTRSALQSAEERAGHIARLNEALGVEP